jgi:hypothetical protein
MLLVDALRVGDEALLVILPANPRAAVADRAQGFLGEPAGQRQIGAPGGEIGSQRKQR